MQMQVLSVINPDNIERAATHNWKQREAVRVVVFNQQQHVGLLYLRNIGYYKLPGGGIEEGEDPQSSALRECREELGADIKILSPLGKIEELRSAFRLYQVSYCFVAETRGGSGHPQFSDTEQELGMQIRWVDPEKALGVMGDFENAHLTDKYGNITARERDYTCLLAGYRKYISST